MLTTVRGMSPTPEFVRLEVADGVGTIRLDRPPMNALSAQVQTELAAAAEEASERADVRAVVVYGGEKLLAAGADITELQAMTYAGAVAAIARLQGRLGALADVPKPTVAAVTGYALGGGLEVALACDFRVCGDTARLGLPEILLGVIPGGGGTQRLARLVGPAKAKDMVFTGRHVRADEALTIGLVDEVVPHAEVYDAALRRATRLAAGPGLALRAAKAAIDQGLEVPLASGLAIEQAAFAGLFATEDRATGMASFLEQGPGKAVFAGR